MVWKESLRANFTRASLSRRFEGRPNLVRSATNASWLVADKFVRLIVGLFVNVWIARRLGPDGFGSLGYAQSIVMMFVGVSTLGLTDMIVRDFVREPGRSDEIAANAIALRIVGAVIALTFSLGLAIILRPNDTGSWVLVSVIGVMYFAQSMDVVDCRFQAMGVFRELVLLRNYSFLVVSILKCVALIFEAPVYVIAVLMTLELFLTAIAFYFFAIFKGHPLNIRLATWQECMRQLRGSWFLLLRIVAIGIYMRADQVMLGRMLGDHSVGIYSAASRISELWYLVPMSVMTAVNPYLTKKHQESDAAYEKELVKVMQALTLGSLAVALIISLLAPFIIQTLYGANYAASSTVLTAHIWAGAFVAVGAPASSWLLNNGLLRYGFYQALLGAVVGVLMNFILIPLLGVTGPAYSVLISYFVSAVAMNAFFIPTRPLFRLQLQSVGLFWGKLR